MAAMGVVLSLYLYLQVQSGQESMHKRGVALAKLVSRIEGGDGDRIVSNLTVLFEHQLTDAQFAYGVVEGADGWSVSPLVSSTVAEQLPNLPADVNASWVQSRELEIAGAAVQEFYGLLPNAERKLVFRFGLWRPVIGVSHNDLRVGATLGIPVLLLVPLFLFFASRQARPIERLSAELQALTQDGKSALKPLEVGPSGDFGDFMQRFNTFVDQVQGRLQVAEKTNRKLISTEKFLTYRADRLEAILQGLPEGILILGDDHKVVFANRYVESVLSRTFKEITGSPLESWCDYAPLHEFLMGIRRDAAGTSGQTVTMPYPHQPNKTMGVSAHAIRLGKSKSASAGVLVQLRDISEEVAAKQSRVDFVGSLSHEIKAPLNTIGLYAQMLESSGDDEDFRIETHNVITREVDRLTRLVHNLLSITQIEMGTFELDSQRVHLVDVVKDCVEILDHGEDQARISVRADDKVTPVSIDKELMRIAISNLMTNALKYSPEDAPVVVEIEETEDVISLAVVDKGLGISEHDQKRIFDKFFRSADTDAQAEAGHGLGLSIAAEIVKLHHGTLSLESKLGEGSRFTIELWKRTGVAAHAI